MTIGEVLDRLATGPYPFGDVGDRRHLTVRLGLYRFDGNPALTDVLVYVIEGIATGCGSRAGAPPGPGQTSPPVVEASCETTSIANADTGQSLLVIQRGIGTSSQDAPPSGFPTMPTMVPPPDLGDFETADALLDALRASGPLSNESAAAQAAGTAPSRSICVDIVEGREPTVGAMIHEAIASLAGDGGVLVVFERADGTRQARLYSTGAADATGGCRLIMAAQLP